MVENYLIYYGDFTAPNSRKVSWDAKEQWAEYVDSIFEFRFSLILINRELTPENYGETEQWCVENFNDDFVLYRNAIYFKNEIDLMTFKLGWL